MSTFGSGLTSRSFCQRPGAPLYIYSNGFTEGCNNKIKVLKRISFGLRNFERFRNRILYINTPNEKGTPQSRTYTVNDIAAILGIGRATAYKLANSGAFKTIRIGNMIRISRKSFEDWLKIKGLDDETEIE